MVVDLIKEEQAQRSLMRKCIEVCRPQAVAEAQRRYNNCVCDNTKKSVEAR